MTIDLSNFGLGEMLRCSLEVRRAARSEATMEATARRLARFFYEELRAGDNGRACVLVRIYKTHPLGALPDELQRFARRALRSADLPIEATDGMKCLTLLATVGDEPSWNERRESRGHQAIPLPSPQLVQRAPMIAQLVHEFGLALSDLLRPSPDIVRKLEGKTYGVFHVAEALGSPFIPAQAQFVERHGVRSVVGFGGSLVGGELFAVILFTRTLITADAADRFRTIALDVKGCLVPFDESQVFGAPTA